MQNPRSLYLPSPGLSPGQRSSVGLLMQNRPEWTLVEQGCYCFSMVTVPLYDALGEDTCAYVIDKVTSSGWGRVTSLGRMSDVTHASFHF